MKKEIELFDYTTEILKSLQKGALLTTKVDDSINSMTISWGTIGIEWGKPIFTVLVREHRFTKQQLEKNPEFTINLPYGAVDKKILGFCGSKSGRQVDKIKELGLTLESPHIISVPAIKELPLTLECKIIYQQEQDQSALTADIKKKFYPPEVDSFFPMENKDFHTAFHGEIVSAYIIES